MGKSPCRKTRRKTPPQGLTRDPTVKTLSMVSPVSVTPLVLVVEKAIPEVSLLSMAVAGEVPCAEPVSNVHFDKGMPKVFLPDGPDATVGLVELLG